MDYDLKLAILGTVFIFCSVFTPSTAQPSCPAYSISVGINTTAGTTLETIACTPSSGTVSYAVDTSSDGYVYFDVDQTTGVLSLANRLDVEYGPVTWTIQITATDGGGSTAVSVTVRTFLSTTTTTSTQPPPGYAWFDQSNNRYLFWSVMAFTALIFGACILLCLRFHRIGKCLPKRWPDYDHMIASFNRQVTCCPLPCDFYDKNKGKADQEETKEEEYIDNTPWGLPLRKPPKPATPKKAATPVKVATPKKTEDKDIEEERSVVITPLVIGNVNLHDVGFDGMRSPGFNAPMFTSYGGKKGTASKVFKKY